METWKERRVSFSVGRGSRDFTEQRLPYAPFIRLSLADRALRQHWVFRLTHHFSVPSFFVTKPTHDSAS